jgi:hypothetical protein
MPARRQLQVIAAVGVTALTPLVLPNHMRPTLIGRREAIEMTERLDKHMRELGIERQQNQHAQAA